MQNYQNLTDVEQGADYGSIPSTRSAKSSSWWSAVKTKKLWILVGLIALCAFIILLVTLLVTRSSSSDDPVQICSESKLPEVKNNPPAPAPERIKITTVPLPPTAPSNTTGSCSSVINPHRTGCIDPSDSKLQSGDFLPDGNHIVASIVFSGAPALPDPSSIYSGPHVIILKVDGTTFSNGDSWKCITCGVPPDNSKGFAADVLDYPQTFRDGKRILAGTNVIDCSPHLLVDDLCTPNVTFIYPIHWIVTADGSGKGGSIRELRLHPNNSYIGFNGMYITSTSVDQFGYMGKLSFNANPTSGIPLVPRYDITNVTRFFDPSPSRQPFHLNPNNQTELLFNPLLPMVGEFRGWSKDGQEVLWIGLPCESGNFDIMSTKLSTGETVRLTRNPEYTDPVDMSPDNMWTVVMDTRGSNRTMFASGMRGIPPLTDLVSSSAVASIRNNGDRRFFQAYLIDRYGDRGSYQGQLLTAEGDGSPGSLNDPNWNGRADPRWSSNGTLIAFWQALVTSPACGGKNPLPCPNSTEPGGRRTRVLIAHLLDRPATPPYDIPPLPETIPWGTEYVPGSPPPRRNFIPEGRYTLKGNVSGTALVHFNQTADGTAIYSVSVHYTNYSDDGYYVIDGDEYVSRDRVKPFLIKVDWKSNLTLSGCATGKKVTSDGGYSLELDMFNPVVESTGSLSTTINNNLYTSPNPGT